MEVDFRLIPPKRREPNDFDDQVTYAVPARITKIYPANDTVVPILIERLDFRTGRMITTEAITFRKSLRMFKHLKLPYTTDAIAYKDDGFIRFKVIGSYNTGLVQRLFDVPDIVGNDERTIQELFIYYYTEINEWAKGIH